MNINLKRTQYSSLFEGLLLTIGGGIVCVLILFGILTNTLDRSNAFIIAGFSLFAGIMLLGIWKLVNKKSSEYVDVNGWKYNLFRKVTKNQFILISGGIKALGYIIIMLLLFLFNLIPWTGSITAPFVLLIIAIAFILTMISGYFEYKKYSSID
jgi:hypothetical protein